jgi:integrase
VLEDYSKRKAKLKSIKVIGRDLRRECADWMDRPIASIAPLDVKQLIGGIAARGHETNAHAVFAMLRGLFNWIVDSGDYGVEVSPCARLKPRVLIGERNIRDRVLTDPELGCFWRASEKLGYPFGKLFQLLALTALRRDEAAEAKWTEIGLDAKLWLVPGARMKNGAAHAVPLTDDIARLLEGLPRWHGPHVFSTTGGRRPVSGFSKAKVRLDALMKADLEAQGKQFEPFVLRDIRRTVRTRLSGLPIDGEVKELLLSHARPGLHKVYDQYSYLEEKRRGLELWHAKLRTIVTPAPEGNVVQLPFAAAR